ncbi:MAG: MgtC/SapB family protein [Chloroflexi bacterium]|nr:MgtC/SapB family protein [Chloroflexota bacterium]
MVQAETVARLLVAAVLGAAVGWERERAEKPVQLRDLLLVSLGAALFTVVSLQGFPGSDTGRVAAQVVTGVGFLGAGAILRLQGTVVGLTTAASIWVSAAIGLAAGAGLYLIAFLTTAISVIVLRLPRSSNSHEEGTPKER